MAYFLVAASGHAAPLASRTTFVGSDPQVDIPIRADFGLAPRHFVVVQQDNGHCVQSLASGAPVTVNGVPVQFQELRVGDWIQAGQIALCYQSDTPVAPPAPAEPVMPMQQASMLPPGYHVSEPPPPPVESDEPRSSGYRRPESPRPLDMDAEEEAPRSSIPGLKNLQRSMAVTDRARIYVEEQKAQQSMGGAVFTGVLAAGAISFLWSASTILPTIFFMAVVGGFGYMVGTAVKWGGKGFDLKFGYTGALCALLCGMAANYERMSVADMVMAAAEEQAANWDEEEEEEDPAILRNRRAELEVANENLKSALTDLGIDPDSPEFANARYEDEGDEEDVKLTSAQIRKQQESSVSWIVVLLYLFGPKSIVSYVIAMGAAYKASFRTLTAEEAARMQFG